MTEKERLVALDIKATIFLRNRSRIALALLFFSFMFAQLTVLRLGNQAGRGYLAEEWQRLVYCFIQFAVIGGYFLHFLARKFLKRGFRTLLLTVLSLVFVCASILLFAPEDSAFYLAVTALCVLLLGFVCGAVYDLMSALSGEIDRPGICISLGYACAVALQYLIQLQFTLKPLIAVFLAASCFAMVVFFIPPREESVREQFSGKSALQPMKIVCASLITFSLLVFVNYYNTYIHNLQIASGYADYNVYSWPRLLMIPGIILFGVVGDIRGGRFLPISALCTGVISILNVLLAGSDLNVLNMCLYYFSLSAAVAYYHLTFLRLAAGTRNQALWAGFGRILDSFVVVISILLGFSDLSPVAVISVDIASLVVIIVMMAVGGDFNLTAPAAEECLPVSSGVPLPALKERFGLTPSEMRVLHELVTTDDKQEAIAMRLDISVSTMRHHITSIYKKTGTQTRVALCKLVSGDK